MSVPTPRILKEIKNLDLDKVEGLECKVNPDNYRHFYVSMTGP